MSCTAVAVVLFIGNVCFQLFTRRDMGFRLIECKTLHRLSNLFGSSFYVYGSALQLLPAEKANSSGKEN
jgi:hypothetical protein